MKLRFRILLMVLSLIGSNLMPSAVHAKEVDLVSLKLAFISGFAKFTKWSNSGDHLNVCYINHQDIANKIRLMDGQPTQSGEIQVNELGGVNPHECDLLIINGSRKITADFLANFDLNKTLIVCNECDVKNIADIVLYRKRNRLVFEVNLTRAKQKDFQFSSNLLELASEVR